MSGSKTDPAAESEHMAGNGLLHRRLFLTRGLTLAGAFGVAGQASAQPARTVTVGARCRWRCTYGALTYRRVRACPPRGLRDSLGTHKGPPWRA